MVITAQTGGNPEVFGQRDFVLHKNSKERLVFVDITEAIVGGAIGFSREARRHAVPIPSAVSDLGI